MTKECSSFSLGDANSMAAALPFACLMSLFLVLQRSQSPDWRATALKAAVAWGVLVTALTEILGALRLLEFRALCLGWGSAVVVLLVTWRARPGRRRASAGRPEAIGLCAVDKTLLAGIAFVTLCTGAIAWAAPPNTADSMTYHLSRVMHWLQNRSVAFYPTHVPRQLYLAPWSEFAILQLRILGGDDRLANFVQWFAMIGSLLGVSRLAKEIGATIRGQIFASAICVSIPMGILQSTSTQTDYVAAFWLVCFAYFSLAVGKSAQVSDALATGAALGLAVLTKATAYLFACPFVVWLACRAVLSRKPKSIAQVALVLVVALGVNAGHYGRTVELYGTALGPANEGSAYGVANDMFSIGATASNVLRNAGLHVGTPFAPANAALENAIAFLNRLTGLPINDERTTWHATRFKVDAMSFHEDKAGNALQLALILASILLYMIQARNREASCYALAVTCGFVLFCGYLKWQPWNSRLHLPLFVLWTPFIGLTLSRLRQARFANVLMFFVILTALPWVFFSSTKPSFGADGIFGVSRYQQYFRTRPSWYRPFDDATRLLGQRNCADLGLDIPGGWYPLFEYPAWVLLGQRTGGTVHIEHVNVANISNRTRAEDSIGTAWRPCAIFAMSADPPATINAVGELYMKEWTSAPVSVYVPKARP